MKAREVNFDGLPGLTHHYAGLSFGNEASTKHRYRVSNPQLAAKQGLKKMKALADAGYPQALIPPQERPNIPLLRQIGFSGSDEQVLEKAARQAPELLSAVSSASSMWVANAATVSPSADSLDGRVHLTVANLNDKFHRASEAPTTEALLRAIFPDEQRFAVHGALPQVSLFGDEGAANHNRLGGDYGAPGGAVPFHHYWLRGQRAGDVEVLAVVVDAVDQVGLSDQHAAAGEQGAEGEGKGTENDKDADFLWRQALAAVGPVTYHGTGKYRGADIVGQGIGGEGAERDEAPGDLSAQVGDGDAVVPGQGPISTERGAGCQQPIGVADRAQAVSNLVEGDVAQFAVEQEAGQHYGAKTNQRPDQIAAFQFGFGFNNGHCNSSLDRPMRR